MKVTNKLSFNNSFLRTYYLKYPKSKGYTSYNIILDVQKTVTQFSIKAITDPTI